MATRCPRRADKARKPVLTQAAADAVAAAVAAAAVAEGRRAATLRRVTPREAEGMGVEGGPRGSRRAG